MRYVLHVGTLEPRKNLPLLLDAFEALHTSGEADVPSLVLVGGSGWKSDALKARLAQLERAGWLQLEGYADDDRLADIYRHAEWLALPSLYEGFGLPVVEAMVAGVPLLLSDIPVLREMAGDAALYASPTDGGAWTELLRRALAGGGDSDLRRKMAETASARARAFDWHRTSEETVAVCKEAAALNPIRGRERR